MYEDFDFSTMNLKNDAYMLRIGTVVRERYRIVGLLGFGGMGRVYHVVDLHMPEGSRPFAMKETMTDIDENPNYMQSVWVKALDQEARIMAHLEHPSIPQLRDYFSWERRWYLVMDYIDGVTLTDKINAQKTEHGTGFDERRMINYAIQICKLFEYLHQQKHPIIYRDGKPDNIMVTPEERIKLIDFGIARHLSTPTTRFTSQYGTRGYAAPESYSPHEVVDWRADLFSLGVIFHVMLTAIDPLDIHFTEWTKTRPSKFREGISPNLETIIMKCLQQKPEERWGSARQLRDALESVGVPPRIRTPESDLLGVNISSPPSVYANMVNVEWEATTKGAVRSSPVVSNGLVYFGSEDHRIYSISLANGKIESSLQVGGAICSDPVVTDRAVLFGSQDGAIYAIDRALKRKLWNAHTGHSIVSSPIIQRDQIVIGNDAGVVSAFALRSGESRWRFETWGPVRGVLAGTDDTVFFGSHDEQIYAIDHHGELRWKRPARGQVEARPVLANKMVIVGGMDQNLYNLHAEGGYLHWRRKLDGAIISAVAVRGHHIFVGTSFGKIYCLDYRDFKTVWSYNGSYQITSDLVMHGTRIYFGCADGGLYCLDTSTQDIAWQFRAGGPIVTRPALVNNLVIVGSLDHRIYAVRDDTLTTPETS